MMSYRHSQRGGKRPSPMRKPRNAPSEPYFEGGVLDEPFLVFGGHHKHIDPKTGLAVYGPYSVGRNDLVPLRSITVGVIGTPDLIFRMKNWLRRCQSSITNDGAEPFWRPAFPGINENTAFQCGLFFGEAWQEPINEQSLQAALAIGDYWGQLKAIVGLYTSALERVSEREPKPSVVICITPEEIDVSLNARAAARENSMSSDEDHGALSNEVVDLEGEVGEMLPVGPVNVRRALKAAFMACDIPTQIVRGSTLGQPTQGQSRRKQDEATSAWNLVTGLYYKAGSHPWRLADVQMGSCFVGISFYQDGFGESPAMRTSLAQIFTHSGDGLILRGKSFPWDRSQGPSPHLPEDLAEELLREAIQLYTRHARGAPPSRLIVHKSSRFDTAERTGFQKALGNSIPVWDLVAIEKRGVQFYRQGYNPPLRGTWIRLEQNDYLLYTRGYIPFLRIYPGMRVPRPLEIVEHIGGSPADVVLNDILALSKMNWNSADFCGEEPITLAFSRKVGEILALIPSGAPVREEYRYYM